MTASKVTSKKTAKTAATSVRKKKQSTASKSATTKKKATRKRTKKAQVTASTARPSRLLVAPQRVLLVASRVLANPVPMLPMMQSTARYSGIFFVVFGAVYALYFSQMLYANPNQFVSTVHNSAQVAELSSSLELNLQSGSTSSSVEANISTDDILSPVTSVNQRPAAQFTFEPAGVFRDTVTVRVRVPDATSVNLSAFIETYRNHVELGSAKRVSEDEWEYMWDTTQFAAGNYRVVADITNQYTEGKPYRSSHFTYLTLDNSEPEPEPEPEVESESEENEDIVSDTVDSVTETLPLDDITESESDQESTTKPEADPLTLREKRDAAYEALQEDTENLPLPDVVEETTSDVVDAVMQAAVQVAGTSPVSGTVPIRISTTPATAVEVYVQSQANQSQARRFIGVATRQSANNWQLQYDTTQTPDGQYMVIAVVRGEQGRFEAEPGTIAVRNAEQNTPAPRTQQQSERIETLSQMAQNVPSITTAQSPTQDQSPAETPVQSSAAEPNPARALYNNAYQEIEADLDRVLRSIEIANTYNSDIDIDTLSKRTNELRDRLLSQASELDNPEAFRDFVRDEFAQTLQAQRQQIESQRNTQTQTDSTELLDSDQDGVYDYDEVNIFGTDPFDPDTDDDGVLDGIEIMRGTNPLVADAKPTVFESPKEAGIERADLLEVTGIQTASSTTAADTTITDATPEQSTSTTAVLLQGRAIPNSFVTLYIFSQPTVVTVRTASDGSWEYKFEKELEDGTHTVYAALTDHAGRVVAKSEPFTFVKQAEAFFPAGSMVANQPQAGETSLFSSYVFYMMMSLSVISLGLILMLIGFHIQNKRREDEAYAAV